MQFYTSMAHCHFGGGLCPLSTPTFLKGKNMSKSRSRYVAGIVYKDKNPNEEEYDLFSLKGVLFEEALEHFEECKESAKNNIRKCKAVLWELHDCHRS